MCLEQVEAAHEKTRALARELLNDFDTFWVTLDHPELPLTNNDAERALRHWVIARRISQGSRTAQGSRTVAVLASVIETCRKRGLSPWDLITEAVTERRRGRPAPLLPAASRAGVDLPFKPASGCGSERVPIGQDIQETINIGVNWTLGN